MARPRKDQADYFPHFTHHGKTVSVLENRYGLTGYAVWFKLLESLSAARGHYLDLNDPIEMEFQAAKLGVDAVSGAEILDTLAFLRAIDPDLWAVRVVWCENLVQNLQPLYRKRADDVPLKPDPQSFRRQSGADCTVSGAEMQQSKAEQSRAEKSKVSMQNSTSSESTCVDPPDDGAHAADHDFPDGITESMASNAGEMIPTPRDPEIDQACDADFAEWRGDLVNTWNSLPSPPFHHVRQITPDRAKHIRARFAESEFRDGFRELIDRIRGTPFLRGMNDRSWTADFDWFIRNPQNYVKILEGKYDRSKLNGNHTSPTNGNSKPGRGQYMPTAAHDAERRRRLGLGES